MLYLIPYWVFWSTKALKAIFFFNCTLKKLLFDMLWVEPEGKIKVRLFEVVFVWRWHLSLSFSVKYHLFALVCSKPYCRTGCNPTPISFPVLFPKTCYSEFAAASVWEKAKKWSFLYMSPNAAPVAKSSVLVRRRRWSVFRKKIVFHQGHCFIYWLWYFKFFLLNTQTHKANILITMNS